MTCGSPAAAYAKASRRETVLRTLICVAMAEARSCPFELFELTELCELTLPLAGDVEATQRETVLRTLTCVAMAEARSLDESLNLRHSRSRCCSSGAATAGVAGRTSALAEFVLRRDAEHRVSGLFCGYGRKSVVLVDLTGRGGRRGWRARTCRTFRGSIRALRTH
uniref:Uncharacterized protein n=1 Tax=Plectus sambesii TaxID=2011161 RepID=A0A914X6T6_9BILA